MTPQTIKQILCCLTLGGYTARVVEGGLETEGPQSLAGPLPASIGARHDELVTFLNEHCGGAWPPAPGSDFYREPASEERPKEPLKKPLTVEEQLEGEEF